MNFSYEYDISAAFPNYMYVEKAAKKTFEQKTRAYNVDEIDTWNQLVHEVGKNAGDWLQDHYRW